MVDRESVCVWGGGHDVFVTYQGLLCSGVVVALTEPIFSHSVQPAVAVWLVVGAVQEAGPGR